jgi:uncharacterized membrane protein YhaH (DUF805 family)
MRFPVWFVRFLFAAWMIPAGLNHFVPLFPQPLGSQPLSQALIHALIDSDLFHIVKAVELVAGIGVLLGLYTPLALLICLPVSFGVFYWDAPLEGWGSRAALFGYATLLCNALLCLAYHQYYRPMFALRSQPAPVNFGQLVLGARLLFGGWMLVNAANYLFLSLWALPAGSEPLAAQLMSALVNSRLLDVAMAIQLLAGVLVVSGLFVPVALCALMPISTCALFWAGVLDQQLLTALLALAAFALNGLLMLAYLPYYRDVLQRHALAIGEVAQDDLNHDALFVNPVGRSAREPYVPALLTVLAAMAFFGYFVTGRTAQFCMLVLLYPAFVLLARRLQDMGTPLLLVLVPLLPMLAVFAVLLGYFTLGGTAGTVLPWAALAIVAAFATWGGTGKHQP